MTLWDGWSRASTSWWPSRVGRSPDVAARGRQRDGDMPTRPLVLLTLALGRAVWRRPRYRRIAAPRRVLLAPPISWWQRCAEARVQIRIEGSRTLHWGTYYCLKPLFDHLATWQDWLPVYRQLIIEVQDMVEEHTAQGTCRRRP